MLESWTCTCTYVCRVCTCTCIPFGISSLYTRLFPSTDKATCISALQYWLLQIGPACFREIYVLSMRSCIINRSHKCACNLAYPSSCFAQHVLRTHPHIIIVSVVPLLQYVSPWHITHSACPLKYHLLHVYLACYILTRYPLFISLLVPLLHILQAYMHICTPAYSLLLHIPPHIPCYTLAYPIPYMYSCIFPPPTHSSAYPLLYSGMPYTLDVLLHIPSSGIFPPPAYSLLRHIPSSCIFLHISPDTYISGIFPAPHILRA